MGYAAGQPIVWPFTPDWSQPVTESLAWLTDAMQAKTGGVQARSLRSSPRRSFSFQSTLDGGTRRIVDAVRFGVGNQQFLLPIYPDVQWFNSTLPAGSTIVPCRTSGFDFVEGGQVLFWLDEMRWELGVIDSITADSITLVAGTTAEWGRGARLYPMRKARLADVPKASYYNDEVAAIDAQLLVDEPCDWPAAWPTAAMYRGQPVLEWRNEESEDPTDQYDRLADSIDVDTGPIYYFDLAGMPFRAQSQRFHICGRERHSAFRALAYQLAGRAAQCWVPSWQNDLCLVQAVSAGGKSLTVSWMGYTRFSALQPGRRDVRVELCDGTTFYRRITGSTEGGDTEQLTIDSAFGVAIDPSMVHQINWLTLCSSAADAISIEHQADADGAAVATLNWTGVKNDV